MRIAIISTTVYQLKPSFEEYGGTEYLVTECAQELARQGHQVAVVAPEGSDLGPGVEIIPVALRESEDAAWAKYRQRLHDQDAAKRFDVIWDNTFQSWIYMDSIGVDPPLPIVKTHHTSPLVWDSLPPVAKPCLVGVSRSHARALALRFGVTVEAALNGVNTSYYKPPATPKAPVGAEAGPVPRRNGRLLYVGRFMAEKGVLDAMLLCKRLRMPLDCYGDTQLVNDQTYVERCRRETDGLLVRMFPNVTRAKLVEAYQTYRALIFTPNWDEPFGLVPVEAAACGMPVVAIGRGGVAETVKHGETGYLCDDLQGVEKVLRSGCVSGIKSDACVAWATEHFSIPKMVARYLELFERVRQGQTW